VRSRWTRRWRRPANSPNRSPVPSRLSLPGSWFCHWRITMGWIASMGRSPKKGRTWSRSRISVAANVVGLRVGSVDHTAHQSSAHRLNGSRPRRRPCQGCGSSPTTSRPLLSSALGLQVVSCVGPWRIRCRGSARSPCAGYWTGYLPCPVSSTAGWTSGAAVGLSGCIWPMPARDRRCCFCTAGCSTGGAGAGSSTSSVATTACSRRPAVWME
jgi:hypothetical protein